MNLSSLIRLLDRTFNKFGDCQVTDVKRLTELEDKCFDDVAITVKLRLYGKTESIEIKIVNDFVYWEEE